jgi:hypothetical protein
VLMLVSVLVFGVVYKFVRTWGLLLSPASGHNSMTTTDGIPANITSLVGGRGHIIS